MKKITLSILMFASSLMANAQIFGGEGTRNISLEFFGAHNTIGLNYDARLKGNDGWGYRAGIGYTYAWSSGLFKGSSTIKGVSVPIEINYLLGKKKSKLELGFGANVGYYEEEYDYYLWPDYSKKYRYEHNSIGYFFFGNVGYRLQPTRGFVFRVGVTPSFNFGDSHGISRSFFYPYISFGWAF